MTDNHEEHERVTGERSSRIGPPRRLNIAHILPWTTVGGVERATLGIARSLDKGRFKHVAFHVPGAKAVHESFADIGVESFEYIPAEPSYRHSRRYLGASFALAKSLKHQQIDLVHCSDLLGGYYAALAGRIARIPVLCHVRGIFSQLSKRDRSFLLAVNHFAFVSKDTWKRFGHAVPPRKGTVVYDGIDPTGDVSPELRNGLRAELGIPVNANVIGMVARVAAAKDFKTLVDAAVVVINRAPDSIFLIVGDNSGTELYRQHYTEVKQLLRKAGILDRFIFTGHREDVGQFYDAMDIFVLSTHTEGLPLVILEAMAKGKPVIATRVGGIPEIVRHGVTGFLHEHEDSHTFASQILTLIGDKDLGRHFGRTGREEIDSRWTLNAFAENMANLYLRLTSVAATASELRHPRGEDQRINGSKAGRS